MIKLRQHQQHCLKAMQEHSKGQLIVPTGGGKTMCMIKDTQREFNSCEWNVILKDPDRKTVVVVAPRILLSHQLCEEFIEHLDIHPMLRYKVLHVHSGYTHHDSTTRSSEIVDWIEDNYRFNKLIFTTYHSLHRIQEADVAVDTIFYDEAHNSVQKNFIGATEHFSWEAKRSYFFTATPKHSLTPMKVGMNDEDIYGKELVQIPAPDLVDQGVILPPKVVIKKIDIATDSRNKYEHDCDNVIASIDDQNVDKILICARSTKQIVGLVSQTKFYSELRNRGYSLMYITSKTGPIINGKKVNREKFFDTLKTEKKFVVMHYSILSEGISVKGLEAALFLRNMDYIGISQTIGRVIRTGAPSKTYGLVVVPTYDKVGISTAKKVQAVVDTVFHKGQPAISEIRR